MTRAGVETVLARFGTGSSEGGTPQASLIDVKGTLYGTAYGYGKGT